MLVIVTGLELVQPVDAMLSRGAAGVERRPGGSVIEPIEGAGRTGKAFAKQAADVGKGPILGPLGEEGRARRVEGDGEDSGVSGHEGKLHSDGRRATGDGRRATGYGLRALGPWAMRYRA